MKKYLTIILTAMFCFAATSSGFAALTVIKDYKITVTIPESAAMSENEAAQQKDTQELQKQENHTTILEQLWQNGKIILVKTNVVK